MHGFLAATDASERVDKRGFSQTGLPSDEKIGPEIRDYLRRYQPDPLIHLTESGRIERSIRTVSGQIDILVFTSELSSRISSQLCRKFLNSSRADWLRSTEG